MRLLVFDDDDATARVIVRAASMIGYDAMAVTDAGSFARKLNEAAPQIIILDLQLGETDGIEQLRLLAERQFAGAVVLMSGFDSRVLAAARGMAVGLNLQVEGVLNKPLHLEALEAILQRLYRAGRPVTVEILRQAIENREMSLDFQAVVTRKPKRLHKLEALARWDRPGVGRIAAGEFLAVAESDAATMDALTDWVIEAAIEAWRNLREAGLAVPISVNLSAHNLRDLTLPDRLGRLLAEGGMPAQHFHIEIVEQAAIADTDRVMAVMMRLRLKGMVLSLNNFGTGYSSLRVLREMPFSEVKIDRGIVRDMVDSPDERSILKSVIDLAASLGLSCTAEGVESEAAAEMLEQLGVTHLQGNAIAPPMRLQAVPAWLSTWSAEALCARPVPEAAEMMAPRVEAEDEFAPLDDIADSPPGKGPVHLPPRQRQVMQLLAEGCSVKEIARRLGIGPGTVKVHLSLAYSALGTSNRIEAIRRAGALGERVH